jgi:hypothetical protein
MSSNTNQELNNKKLKVKAIHEVSNFDAEDNNLDNIKITNVKLLRFLEFYRVAKARMYLYFGLMYGGLIASCWYSVVLALTITTTFSEKVMAVITALVLQISTMVFLENKRYIMATCLFILSIFCTLSFQYNMVNNIIEASTVKTETNTNTIKEESIRRIDDSSSQVNTITANELASLNSSKITYNAQLKKLMDDSLNIDSSKGAWWVTLETKRINKDINDLNTKINEADLRIAELNNISLNSISNKEVKVSEISDITNNNASNITSEVELRLPNRGFIGISKNIASMKGYKLASVILVIQIVYAVFLDLVPIIMLLTILKRKRKLKSISEKGNPIA